MKKRRLFHVLTSAVLTAVMVGSMGISAFAATGVTGTGDSAISSITISKTLLTDGNTYEPAETFGLTIVSANPDTNEKIDGITVYEGVDGALSSDGFAFTPNPTADTQSTYTKTGTLDISTQDSSGNALFTKTGIYKYKVSESGGTYEGIVYDKTEYYVYLYVYQNSTDSSYYVGAAVTTTVTDGVEGKTDLTFKNNYGCENPDDPDDPDKPYDPENPEDPDDPENPDPEDPDGPNYSTRDITLTKTLSGDMADANQDFTFTVGVEGAEGEYYKVVYYVVQGGTANTTSVASGSTIDIDIKGTGSITIYGLTKTDTYTITEADYSSDGYTTTVNNIEKREVTGTVSHDETEVEMVNAKNSTTPTGIVLTFAPYILLVVFAGIFGVLFLKRKHEEF